VRDKNLFQFFSQSPKPKIDLDLVLDIGTESVKGLILEKKEDYNPAGGGGVQTKVWQERGRPGVPASGQAPNISVLGSSLEYYDQYSRFLTSQFEREVIKRTISKAIAELERESGAKTQTVILGLSPNILVSRVISQSYKRKKRGIIERREKEEILEKVLVEGRNKISQIYALEKGILPEDLQFLNFKILETKIEGYSVLDISNYDGKNLDFRILASFLPKYYLKPDFSGLFSPIPVLREMGFEISGIIHEVQGLIDFLVQNPEGIFLDIGGETTQIFLARDGVFEKISEFNRGGKDFSQVLSEKLGLQEPEARALKHRYAKSDLSEESRQRIRQFFEETLQSWFKNLKDKLKEMSSGSFPSEIFIFGGSVLLPEIEAILEQADWEDISFAYPPEVKFLKPNDLIDIKGKIGLTPQYTPSLLLYYGKKIF